MGQQHHLLHTEESKMSTPGDKHFYTYGYSPTTVQRLARRTAARIASFFLPYLRAGMHVLDCGCGPGSITIGLADVVAPGEVVGIDIEPSQITLARTQAAQRGLTNIRFEVGNVMQLPFPEATFDAVFGSNILMQFQDPLLVLTEVCRVVKPGGVVGFRELTFDGNLYEPPAGARHQYYALLTRMMQHNGGEPFMGRRLGTWLCRAGFRRVTMAASYVSAGTPEEKQAVYEEQARLCEEGAWMEQAIALGWISRDGREHLRTALRAEGVDPEAFSAVASCEVVGWKAGPTPEL
jgi:ubiquinone/menaquinone biosynthesis C-methylase UbiE